MQGVTKSNNNAQLPGVVWNEFLEGTTLHGARFLTANHSTLKRIFWLLCVVGMATWFGVVLTNSIIRYRQYPTGTRIQVRKEKQIEFPAITFCNANTMRESYLSQQPQLIQDALLTLSYIKTRDKVNFSDPAVVEALDEYNATQVFLEGSHTLGDMLILCYWEMVYIPCDQLFRRRPVGDNFCYTFNPVEIYGSPLYSKRAGQFGGFAVLIDVQTYEYTTIMTGYTSSGIRLMVHDPSEHPDISREIAIAPGASSRVSIKKHRMLGLPTPYNNSWCEESAGSNNITSQKNYSYSACEHECFSKYFIQQCGCRAVTSVGEEVTCGLGTFGNCFFSTIGSFQTDVSVEKDCGCYQPCDQTQYTYSVSNLIYPGNHLRSYLAEVVPELNFSYFRDNHIDLKIFLEDLSYEEIVQYGAYTLNDLAATVGGQMGLFIGASLLTAVEFIDVLWQLVVILVAKCGAKTVKIENDRETKGAEEIKTTTMSDQFMYYSPPLSINPT